MQPRALKYILDIESVIEELEHFKSLVENNFENYQKEIVVKRATERNLEIIGEAIKKFHSIEPNLKISSSAKIIGLRNLIAHAYDSVDDEIIWAIIQKNIPTLSEEIKKLKAGS